MKTDTRLDPAFCFNRPLSKYVAQPRAIFLTGATGFIGAFLLAELLEKTQATVYYLVRGSTLPTSVRLKTQLQFYQLWQETFATRLIPVVGDLSVYQLGLSAEHFAALAEKIDLIYHCAARMNPVDSYAEMKSVNVFGTVEILRLAHTTHTKPVHYVSTLAVFSNSYTRSARNLTETEQPRWDAELNSGYSQSKWVAEHLLETAKQRGLPVCIYRPDIVLGQSRTGHINPAGHFLLSVLLACIACQKFPQLKTSINFVPVDYVSRAIVYLSQQPDLYGKIFHLNHPAPVSWQTVGAELRMLGYLLDEMPYSQWLTEMAQHSPRAGWESVFLHVRSRLALNQPIYLFSQKPTVDSYNTRLGLAQSGIVCPPLNRFLLQPSLDFLKKQQGLS